MNKGISKRIAAVAFLLYAVFLPAQQVNLSARVELLREAGRGNSHHFENVLFWLSPIGAQVSLSPAKLSSVHPRLTQQNKSFEPHLLVVPVGTVVEFPNRDPFFHNVFSLFEGKRFDLGLYEAGSTREVAFDKPGISYIFCNIHANMSAVVVALDTPYYGISDQRGEVIIPNVPLGRYTLHIWYETALPQEIKAMSREIRVQENSSSLGVFRMPIAGMTIAHKNKYGKDYDPPAPDNPAYP